MIRLPSIAQTVIGSGGSFFNPSRLAGLAAWYSADYGVLTQATNAANFVAANSEYLSAASNPSLQTGLGSWEISCWINPASITESSFGVYIAKSANSSGNTQDYILYRPESGSTTLRLIISNVNGASGRTINSSAILSVGSWVFVTFGYNGTDAFLNVNNGATSTGAITGATYQGDGALTIGGSAAWGYYSSSVMSMVGFWKRTLTSDERTFLYNTGVGRLHADLPSNLKVDLVSYWNLTEGSGQRNDSHGTNHLTDNNTVSIAAGPHASPAADGQTVRRWMDRSGNGRHLDQTTLANQPIYNNDGCLFSFKEMRSLATSLPQPLTIFAASQVTSGGAGDNYILGQWNSSSLAGRWTLYYNVTSNKDLFVQRVSGNDNKRIFGQQNNVRQNWIGVILASSGDTSCSLSVAEEIGTSVTTGGGGSGSTPNLAIQSGTGTSNHPITIFEMGIVSGQTVSPIEITKLKKYLAVRWGAV